MEAGATRRSPGLPRNSKSPGNKSETDGAVNNGVGGGGDPGASKTTRSSWRQRIAGQLKEREIECPMRWTTSTSIYKYMSLEKLEDLVTLAPSVWDRIVRQMVHATWLLYSDKHGDLAVIKTILGRCHSTMKQALSHRDSCPILNEYRDAMLHVLYSTFVASVCVFEQKDVQDMPVAAKVSKFSTLPDKHKAAVSAIRGQFMFTCYLARSSFITRRDIPYADAMLAASSAKERDPWEGQWKSLYGALLPDDNPRKLTLLQRGYLARRTPLTTVSLADYMLALDRQDLAAELCTQAVLQWPDSAFAALSYVELYLSCPEGSTGRKRLSRTFSERCMFRVLELAPRCLYAVALTHELLGKRTQLDTTLVPRALVLYDPDSEAPWCLTQPVPEDYKPPQFDRCNCVCSSRCCHLTFRAHGTLNPSEEVPITCYDE